jgi:DNA-binding transcriptional LysR family regulator
MGILIRKKRLLLVAPLRLEDGITEIACLDRSGARGISRLDPSACRNSGFEPIIGQLAPQSASIVNLVAAELGITIIPASMMQVRATGVAYRQIAGQSPTTRLALAYRRGETSPVVRNFIARAVS